MYASVGVGRKALLLAILTAGGLGLFALVKLRRASDSSADD